MNHADAHDDHTRNATIRQVIEYLTELASSDDPRLLDAGVHREAAKLYMHLRAALLDLDEIRDVLAHIDTRNDGDNQ